MGGGETSFYTRPEKIRVGDDGLGDESGEARSRAYGKDPRSY